MLDTVKSKSESIVINHTKAIELASLVGSHFVFRGEQEYKQLLESDYNKAQAFHNFLKTGEIQEVLLNTEGRARDAKQNKEGIPGPREEIDLEALISEDFTEDILERIRNLYAIPEVREIYQDELKNRKAGFDMLNKGYAKLNKLKKLDTIIIKAKDKILEIKVQAFKKNKKLSPQEVSLIKRIQSGIQKKQETKDKLLESREIATAYRLEQLKIYKHQLDTTGFIMTPSRESIVEDIIEKILLGQNVLLTGPTGTGKTVLAIEAVKNISRKLNLGFQEIDGKALGQEIQNNPEQTKQELNDFVSVLSGHAGITPSEFIAKTRLKQGSKGGTETYSQLGKVLQAFVDGKIPIIDEIDLIPNDVLMRIKHLFTLRVGENYSPQEDGNTKYKLLSTSIIATANIKSAKHPDREDIDPAIIRLFKGQEVKYFSENESYDLAIVNLMNPQGYIKGVGKETLTDQQKGIVPLLIAALKDIENNYLGKGAGETISNKSKQYLRKAILDPRNFLDMLVGHEISQESFVVFVKQKIISFISNGGYPKTDRMILIKMFSSKGLITKEDISAIESKSSDISDTELQENIVSENFEFAEDTIEFVDPYELANLDPYQQRNLESKELLNKNSMIISKLKSLSRGLMTKSFDDDTQIEIQENLQEQIDALLDTIETASDNYEIAEEDISTLLGGLYNLELKEEILELKQINDKRKAIFDHILLFDQKDPNSKHVLNDIQDTENTEDETEIRESLGGLSENLQKHILLTNKTRVDKLKSTGEITIEGGYGVQTHLTHEEKIAIPYLKETDLKITARLNRYYQGESYTIIQLNIKGESYTAIKVPKKIRTTTYKESHIGSQMLQFVEKDRYPAFLTGDKMQSQLGQERVLRKEEPAQKDEDRYSNINLKAKDPTETKEDILREISKKGMGMQTITDNIIMAELVKGRFGEEYLTKGFGGKNFDTATKDKEQKTLQEKLKEIQNEFNINFAVNISDSMGYLNRDYSIYRQQKSYIVDEKDEYYAGYFRGRFDSVNSALGGIFSVNLDGILDDSYSNCGFRPGG